MKRLSVLVADDHAIVREGLVELLKREPDIDVVGEAADGEAALAALETLRPAAAVLDLGMPRMTGIEVARKAREAGLPTAIVLLSVHDEPVFVRDAVDAGVCGYLTKDALTRELVNAVRTAAAGGLYLCPRVAAGGLAALRAGPREQPDLTPRERDVLRLVARGQTSKEIAAALGLTPKTVDGFRAAIMDKLEIRSIAGLVKYALKHNLASLDE